MNLKHGYANTPEYKAWVQMKARCYTKSHTSYGSYGAKGVTVCLKWRKSFVKFLADVGPKPSARHSLGRINNRRGYFPDNVRWETWEQQNRNHGNNRVIYALGKSQSISAWSEEVGLPHSTISYRLDSGWPPEEALTTAKRGKRHAKNGTYIGNPYGHNRLLALPDRR